MMGALIRALTNNAVENIEEALGMTDATSSAMKHAIAEWYAAWYGRVPTKTEDPCQRLPYAIVNKLCKATFGEYDSGLQHTDTAKGKYLDCVRSTFDACKTSFMTQAMIGGEAWAKPVPMPDGRLTWQIVGRDSIIILGRDASGIPSDVALCEKSVSADHHFYTLVERRTSFAGRLTIQYRLYCSDNKSTLGRRVPLASLPQYERLEDEYTFAVPIDGVGMVFLRMPITNCVDGSADGVSIYEPAMGLIHRINENELQFSREFELGRMRVVASADILRTHNGKKSLTDDVFVGLDGNEQSIGITPFAPTLRNESYEARRQTYLKAIENLLGIKRGILSDAEVVSKTATEINSSAGDYSLSIMDFQHLYYDALQAALRLGDQIGQAYRLCDASAWSADELTVTWGNGVLYDADQVFGREPSSKVMEVFNDYDAELVNIYRCIKYHPDALQHELDMLPDAREVFFDCLAQEQVRGLTDIQRAARSLYLIKASFGTDRRTFATAPKGVCNISASFPAVQERLRRVIIENLDFEHLIKTYDRENALFYCDPPYFETEKYYRARFQESDHKRLADALHSIKGRFLLSYNDCPQVRELYADCIIEPVSRRNTLSAQSVDGYKEVLVRNYEL